MEDVINMVVQRLIKVEMEVVWQNLSANKSYRESGHQVPCDVANADSATDPTEIHLTLKDTGIGTNKPEVQILGTQADVEEQVR